MVRYSILDMDMINLNVVEIKIKRKQSAFSLTYTILHIKDGR